MRGSPSVKLGVDTNVLVYAHVAALPEHVAARAFLARLLERRDVTLVVTPPFCTSSCT